MELLKLVDNCSLLLLCLLVITVNNIAASNQTIKKDLPLDSEVVKEDVKTHETELHIVATDKSPKQAIEVGKQEAATAKNASAATADKGSTDVGEQQKLPSRAPNEKTLIRKEHLLNIAEETKYHLKPANLNFDDNDIPDSYIKGFYIFLTLSGVAMFFIVVRVYRLRLSRAERKYGVQGDRSTQELVPLPVSIEDGNSDDEDQTLFELSRQQIRIL
ncbi:uncharacterized protein LOC128866207 isoform X2 [Anastrepha ludens]|uniref:uncharacterized protein LOC128866207 isoform X2 n=1 Tax=Anastrepha ludens TaxID=28586 RepID=UPI0023B1F06F|nr:uncharacterized protein LOC128866207 isoform X2 [Anastrepha ludens]